MAAHSHGLQRYYLRDTQQENDPDTQLSSTVQLDARKVDQRRSHIHYVGDDVADTLGIG